MYKIFLFLVFCPVLLFAQNVLINEVMSSNSSAVADEDNEFNDWLELFNNQNSPVNLSGYGISEDSSNLFKWVMPDKTLQPYSHQLIFASGKNRSITHWETIITWGSVWKYFLGTAEPSIQWKDPGFNDALWTSGKSGFGYGDGDDSTIVPQVQSVYVRKVFTIDSLNQVEAMLLHIDFDDAFVAYLNGVEIARENIGTVGVIPMHSESASKAAEALIYTGGKPFLYVISNFKSLLRQGENVLAIQVHNYGTTSSDMTLIPFLTLGLNKIPLSPKGKYPLLDAPAANLHTNFKLGTGEKLFVTNPQGIISDSLTLPEIPSDISYGRKPDGNYLWFYFSQSTPADSNRAPGFQGVAGQPVFSSESGIYTTGLNLTLTPSSPGNTIRYTLDGSDPFETSNQYYTPLNITGTQVVKAKEYAANLLPGRIATNTYLINFSTQLPVMSISTNPENFFNVDYGIYVLGDSADPAAPNYGANFWQDWERPIHIEFFDNDGGKFSADAGVRIYGNWTRAFAQKSLAVYMRDIYGSPILNYKLFPDLPFTEYESFVLRNSGNDWQYTLLRDPLTTSIVTPTGIDKQAYRPVIVFLNGQYWGIHDLREKINEHYLAAHHPDVNSDSVDLLQDYGKVLIGSNADYFSIYNFIAANSMAAQPYYEYVKSKIDIDNFLNYYVAQIIAANRDWPGSNIKCWKKQGSGKWQWIMYDTDFSFGLYDLQGYAHNTLEFATQTNGPDWPNPDWSTMMLRKLLENTSFRNDFINRFADFSNSIFKSQNVVNKILQMKSAIEPEISRHSAKWNQFNIANWNYNIQQLYTFANNRIGYMRTHFQQKFSLAGTKNVNLFISDTSKGFLRLNSLTITDHSWSGIYFMGVPITIIAEPKRGCKFVGWQGFSTSTEDTLVITPADVITLSAVFQTDEQFTEPNIVINEINYNSSLSFNTEDWVEFYNNSDTSVDISGWIFKDEDSTHIFQFPENTLINGRQYLVLCRDSVLFRTKFQEPEKLYGNLSFGLSGSGELVHLDDNMGYVIDSLTYHDTTPWPSLPDGNGPTLSLMNPDFENSLPASWGTSFGYGTPGRVNDNFTDVKDNANLNIPKEYSLFQNYPNPFNPETRIRFSIPKTSFVTLKIYDVLGAEILTLVNKEYLPGTYDLTYNAEKLSTGVYFYRLNAGEFSEVKKMQVLK